jgi:hypothetical protein
VKTGKTAVLGDVDSHWVRTLLSSLHIFLRYSWPTHPQTVLQNNTFLSLCNFHTHLNYFITLNMEGVCSSHKMKHVTTAQPRNIKEDDYQVNNHHENLTVINEGQN